MIWADGINWLYKMEVKNENFEFKMADLPSNMDKIIKAFIKNK